MSQPTLSYVHPRTGIDAPLSTPHAPPSVELCCRVMVETGGGVFAGIFPPISGRSKALVVFKSPATGAALGCFISELSAELVRLKIAASDAAFDATAQ